jgi:putative transposase
MISPEFKENLHKYMTGILQNKGHKMLAIHAMPDHVHILAGVRPNQALSDLVKEIKASSSNWINSTGFLNQKFRWQNGFGAFACNMRTVPRVISYIRNQESHHSNLKFNEEYRSFLRQFSDEVDVRDLFDEI